jgi:hypothetical protein
LGTHKLVYKVLFLNTSAIDVFDYALETTTPFDYEINVNITRSHQCIPISLPSPVPAHFVFEENVDSQNTSLTLNFMSLISSSDPVCQNVTLDIDKMVEDLTGSIFSNPNHQITYSHPNISVDTRMPLSKINIFFRFKNTNATTFVTPGQSAVFLGATIQVKQYIPPAFNLVPVFDEPLPSSLIFIAYNPPSPNDVQFCLPKLIDFEGDQPIVDSIENIGSHSYWTTFDSDSNCFNFKIGNLSLQSFIGEFETNLRVRDNSVVAQTNKTYSFAINIISESSISP